MSRLAQRGLFRHEVGPAELLRLCSIRTVNDCVEQFHVFSRTCDRVDALESAFRSYLEAVLGALRIRVDERSGSEVGADVLELDAATGRLRLTAGTESYEQFVPDMTLEVDASGQLLRPEPESGVAPLAVWAFVSGKPGAVVVDDVQRPRARTRYFAESQDPSVAGLGSYIEHWVDPMYRTPPNGIRPSLRCWPQARRPTPKSSTSASALSTSRTRARARSARRTARGPKPARR